MANRAIAFRWESNTMLLNRIWAFGTVHYDHVRCWSRCSICSPHVSILVQVNGRAGLSPAHPGKSGRSTEGAMLHLKQCDNAIFCDLPAHAGEFSTSTTALFRQQPLALTAVAKGSRKPAGNRFCLPVLPAHEPVTVTEQNPNRMKVACSPRLQDQNVYYICSIWSPSRMWRARMPSDFVETRAVRCN